MEPEKRQAIMPPALVPPLALPTGLMPVAMPGVPGGFVMPVAVPAPSFLPVPVPAPNLPRPAAGGAHHRPRKGRAGHGGYYEGHGKERRWVSAEEARRRMGPHAVAAAATAKTEATKARKEEAAKAAKPAEVPILLPPAPAAALHAFRALPAAAQGASLELLQLLDEAIAEVAFEAHGAANSGTYCVQCGSCRAVGQAAERDPVVRELENSGPLIRTPLYCDCRADIVTFGNTNDLYGQDLEKMPRQLLQCPHCARSVACTRFAPHLAKCMGGGRRAASKNGSKYGNSGAGGGGGASASASASSGGAGGGSTDDARWQTNSPQVVAHQSTFSAGGMATVLTTAKR